MTINVDQSENLTRHLVSMLVLGLASPGVSSSSSAECGTLIPERESNWQKIQA